MVRKTYRLLTKYHARNSGGDINIENTLSPLTIIYWFVIDLGRYIGQKIKSKREFTDIFPSLIVCLIIIEYLTNTGIFDIY